MKVKQLLAAALLFCTAGASAQTDVTSTYITNAGFSSTDGWTAVTSTQYKDYGNGLIGTYGVRTAEGQAVSTVDATHLATEYCFGFEVRWSTSYAAFTQTTSELPIGAYTLTYDVENTNSKTTKATYDNSFFVQIGDVKTTDKSTEWMAGNSSWTTHSITFNVTSPTTATISLGYGTGSNNIGSANTPTLHVSHLKLTWTDPLKAAKDALQAEIDKAKLCDAKEGLADAISAAESALTNATTADELANALATLQTADKDAILRYDNGLADATFAAPVATSFVVNGTFDSGISPWQRTGTYQNNKTANNQSGAFTGNFYENWHGSAQANKMYQTISNIPNGTYRLDIAAFVNTLADPNESQYVFANNDKTYLTTGAPTAYEVYTVVTNNQIEIGLEQTTATANWMGIDNVSLRYYGAGDVINDAKNASHKLAWEEAKAAAEAAVANTDYQNVTGAELTAINAEIAKDEPTTADGYDEAAAALTTATSTFTAAKAAYDAYASFLDTYLPSEPLAYATNEKWIAIGDAYGIGQDVTDAADATAKVEAAKTALRAYYESHAMAEGVEDAVNMTSLLAAANADTNTGWTNGIGTNQGQGYTDSEGNVASKYLDGGWAANAGVNIDMTRSVEIPAGKYLLTVKARGAVNLDVYTLSIAGETIDLPHANGNSNGVFGNGWEDASIEFETQESGTQTLEIKATSTASQQWISLNDFRLIRLELYTEMADADDYAALNDAIAAAEAKPLGFDKDEYAPYNNVEALKAIATAKAIDQNAENAKADVTALTEALTNGWTANDGDVDAIYDGTLANAPIQATSDNVVLPGWVTKSGNTRQTFSGTGEGGKACLADAEDQVGLFVHPGTYNYGETTGYTMPLKAGVIYQAEAKYCAWADGSNNNFTLTILKDNATIKTKSFGKVEAGADTEHALKAVKLYFEVEQDGDYVLSVIPGGNTFMTDFHLKPAATEDLTINEDVNYTPAETYANVTLARTIKADTWNTFVVPFDIDNDELKAAFGNDVAVAEFSENSTDANAVTINFDMMDTPAITANKPVLLKGNAGTSFTFNGKLIKVSDAKVAGKNVDFVGTYDASTTVKAGDYFISANKLYKSEGGTTLKGTRAYIDARNAAEVKMFVDGIVTGIDEINGTAVENGAIYNLAGQRVNKAQKGIYIVNGKKVAVK